MKQFLYDELIESGRLSQEVDEIYKEKLLNTELSNIYPELDRDIECLTPIFRLARILGRKINQNDKSIVTKWNKIADRHEKWLTNYLEKQNFTVRSKTKNLRNIQQYLIIVTKMNALIAKLPSYLVK
ncbi:MAG: hypothetical protein HC908_03865 [Calothrix sp. SM1_7_51]|nr:hypothetical protein [Calothrix sp. SM1_7_51]